MNVLDIEKSVATSIEKSGGSEDTLGIWKSTWRDISSCCDITAGVSDDYTKDVILCWSGWVLAADPEATDCIYSAVKGFNISFKEDEDGDKGATRLMRAIDKHVSDPVNVYRELARDQLDRLRGAGQTAIIEKPATEIIPA